MTPVFCCGAECGVAKAHWTSGATGSFSTTTVRTGSRSLRLSGTSTICTIGTVSLTSATRFVGRCYIWFTTLPGVTTGILGTNLTFADGSATAAPAIIFNSTDSKLYTRVGTTTGASGISVTTGQWYRIDFDFNINTGGNDTCDLQVDGVAASQATATGASGGETGLLWGPITATTFDYFVDDFVLSNTAADYPIGDGYINHFVPTADGTHNIAGTGDFQRTLTGTDILNATTDAFQLVDEVPLEATVTDWINLVAPPNATDYVECIFGPAPGISTPTVAPRAVDVVCGINQSATGTGNMEIRLNDNGTTNAVYSATGVAGVAVATGQVFKRKHYATGPAGAWTVLSGAGNFNNLRIRFGSPAAVDANPDQYFGCAMIEAEFAPNLQPALHGDPFGAAGQRQMNQLISQ